MWDGYQTLGGLDDWPWVDCQYVLVDVNVVLKAPDHLHTAVAAGLEEWRRAAFDPVLAAQPAAYREAITSSFAATLDPNGRMAAASAAHIAQRIKERDGQQAATSRCGSRWRQPTNGLGSTAS